MISIVYAYPLEVKVLKELASENDLQAEICWHRWPSLSSKTEGLIFNVGFAGCLNPGLALGQVVLVNRIMAEGEGRFFWKALIRRWLKNIANVIIFR